MGFNFVSCDSDRAFALPQDVREWLPPGHLCWRVLDVVGQLDLSGFLTGYRADGQGRAAYPPALMVALLFYCYHKGIRSSRTIEAACLDDVGCRVITANHQVDHATIARFVQRHRPVLKDLFVQVLALCGRRGLVDPAAVAVDGSPMSANAARSSNQSLERLEEIIAQSEAEADELMWETLTQARTAEAGEDHQVHGLPRADTSPARLSRLNDRLARARSARDKIFQRALPSAGEAKIKVDAAQRMVARAEQRLAVVIASQQARLDEHARRTREDQRGDGPRTGGPRSRWRSKRWSCGSVPGWPRRRSTWSAHATPRRLRRLRPGPR
jgi:transposase